jgi:hypothetical protein
MWFLVLVLVWDLMWFLGWVLSLAPSVIPSVSLCLKPSVIPCLSFALKPNCLSHVLGSSVIPNWMSLFSRPYVISCLSLVLRIFCDFFSESRFELSVIPCLSHPSVSLVLKPSVIPSVSLGLKPFVSLVLKLSVIPCLSHVLRDLLWFLVRILVWNLLRLFETKKSKEHMNLPKTIVRKRHQIDQRNEEMGRSVLFPEFLIDIRNVTLAFLLLTFNKNYFWLVYKSSGSMFYDYPYQSPDQYQAQVRTLQYHLYIIGIHVFY